MIAIDTSFLCSLFVKDARHTEVVALYDGKEAFALTALNVLEFRNALNQQILRKTLSTLERDNLWEQFEELLGAGVFQEMTIPTTALYQKARELSDRHTWHLVTRSLDLLHLAAAILLKVELFYTFDERQKRAALAEGLRVFP